MRRVFFSPFVAFVAVLIVLFVLFFFSTPQRSHSSRPHQVLAAQLSEDLNRVQLIDMRVRVLGYARERFGHGWGHHVRDGVMCTSRQHELRELFGGSGCAPPPPDATAPDPYTGETIRADAVDIDHVVPLAAAWDLGAWSWDQRTRMEFANDLDRNLIVTSSAVNREKSDATLSEWLPTYDVCAYSTAFVRVVADYHLMLPRADMEAARTSCGM